MYGLYAWLLTKGEIAYLNTRIDVPSVGIYPEIYQGNDMEATTVVRYILQTIGKMGTTDQFGTFTKGPTTFDPSDKIYVFSRIYDTFNVNNNHLLFLPILNLNIFKDLHKQRTKTCFMVGKGENTHKHPKDAIELTRQLANDQEKLAEILNECQYLYGYDHMSAMYDIARLCGCQVKYFGSAKREELRGYEPGLNGIDFGNGTDFYHTAFLHNYEYLITSFSEKLDYFIEETQHE